MSIYGQETRIYGCWHRARPRLLEALESGDEPSFVGTAFAAHYVGYAADHLDMMCAKVMGADPRCQSSRLHAFDLRTGRQRVSVTLDARPAQFALGTRGWLAWVTAPDAQGVREVRGAAGGATRTLDRGAIDPDSIRVRGDDASWRRDGVRRTAPLR